jgi:hypothetical protein
MIDSGKELSPEEVDNLIESIARDVVRRRLETAAVMFLEMNKPLSFVAGQAVAAGTPVLGALFGAEKVARYGSLFGSKENVEKLIKKIEELVAERNRGDERVE